MNGWFRWSMSKSLRCGKSIGEIILNKWGKREIVRIASSLWNSSMATDGSGSVYSVNKAARLRPRSRLHHIRLQTQPGCLVLRSRTSCSTFCWALVWSVSFLETEFANVEVEAIFFSVTHSFVPVLTCLITLSNGRPVWGSSNCRSKRSTWFSSTKVVKVHGSEVTKLVEVRQQ